MCADLFRVPGNDNFSDNTAIFCHIRDPGSDICDVGTPVYPGYPVSFSLFIHLAKLSRKYFIRIGMVTGITNRVGRVFMESKRFGISDLPFRLILFAIRPRAHGREAQGPELVEGVLGISNLPGPWNHTSLMCLLHIPLGRLAPCPLTTRRLTKQYTVVDVVQDFSPALYNKLLSIFHEI